MVMDQGAVEQWATSIWTAREGGRLLEPPSSTGQPLRLDDAYAVQARLHQHRLARGEREVGWKLGYTSTAMREQMGIDEPNCGPLTDAMVLHSGDWLPPTLRHPRVEPEVAFVLGEAGAVTRAHAALEIVDSTWRDYRFTLADNTADGSSAAYIVLGDELAPDDVADLPVLLRVAEEVREASTAAAMGSPWRALAWLGEHLAARGLSAPSGSIVMTGGLTMAVPLPVSGVVSARFGATAGVQLRLGGAPVERHRPAQR
jgi:2-keto-4-pentenoate hydratase